MQCFLSWYLLFQPQFCITSNDQTQSNLINGLMKIMRDVMKERKEIL